MEESFEQELDPEKTETGDISLDFLLTAYENLNRHFPDAPELSF